MYQTDQLITFWSQIKPNDLAFVDDENEVTFSALDAITRKVCQVINEKGLKQGELVSIILPSYLGWLFTLSLYRLGIATVAQNNMDPFSTKVTPDWLISLEPHSGIALVRTVLINDDLLATINSAPAMAKMPGFKSPDDLATLFSTSGTTGETKHIAESAEELRNFSYRPGWNDSFGDEGILNLFMFGAAWANRHALKSLMLGRTYYSCIFYDERLPKFMSKYPIRTIIGSPAQIASFLDTYERAMIKLPLLKTVVMGGSVPSQQMINRIKSNFDCKIFNTYGSVEAGFVGIFEMKDDNSREFSIRPPVRMEIVDENDAPLRQGELGIVRYHRPDMATSYFKNPIASADFFKNGYFYPGDLGYFDPSGRLILAGRINEVINLGGAKLNPEEIDKIGLAQPGVIDCATIAIPGPSGVEQLAIAVVANSGFDLEAFKESMASNSPFTISAVFLVGKVARNDNGKIMRSILSQQYQDSTSS